MSCVETRRGLRAASLFVLLALVAGSAAAQELIAPKPLAELEDVARRDSNDAQAHYQLALAYWSKKRFDEAEQALLTAVTIERRFAAAYLALSYLPYARRPKLMRDELKGHVSEEWRDRLEKASHYRRRAFLIDPLVDLQIVGAVVPMRGVIAVDRRGNLTFNLDPFAAFVRGDYGLAYRWFNSMVDRVRNTPDSIPSGLLWYRGLSAAHVGDYTTAIADFRTLVNRGVALEAADSLLQVPLKTNECRYVLALLYSRAQRGSESIDLYREALGYDVGLFMAHVQMGRIYEQRSRWSEAIDQFERAVAASPDDPSLLLDLGVVLREAGRVGEAAAVLRRAMNENPRDSRVPYHLAVALEADHRPAEARDALNRFLSLAPSRYAHQIADARQRLAALP